MFLGAEVQCADEDREVHSRLLQKGRGATLQSIQAEKTRGEAGEVAWWLRELAALAEEYPHGCSRSTLIPAAADTTPIFGLCGHCTPVHKPIHPNF